MRAIVVSLFLLVPMFRIVENLDFGISNFFGLGNREKRKSRKTTTSARNTEKKKESRVPTTTSAGTLPRMTSMDGTDLEIFLGSREILNLTNDECMDDNFVGYICCRENALSRRIELDRTNDPYPYHMGVTQKVEGTDAEKTAILEVIERMVSYFYGEVLTQPVYRGIRHKCMNMYELCAFWAAVGQWESNRQFMIPYCSAACRFCLLHDSVNLEE